MKANDLMIGDWVISGQYVTTVKSLSDGIRLNGCIGKVDEVMAVKITPAILEKNGFNDWHVSEYEWTRETFIKEAHVVVDYREKDACTIYVGLGITDLGGFDGVFLTGKHYVHELQHALRLCGIEKEIII